MFHAVHLFLGMITYLKTTLKIISTFANEKSRVQSVEITYPTRQSISSQISIQTQVDMLLKTRLFPALGDSS